MTDILNLSQYRRRKERLEEIRQRAIRIGISLKTINKLMKELREMARPDYREGE